MARVTSEEMLRAVIAMSTEMAGPAVDFAACLESVAKVSCDERQAEIAMAHIDQRDEEFAASVKVAEAKEAKMSPPYSSQHI
ncbi:MAG: hypothetical protein V3S01_06905 [Dehalococcoidia bacterium]